MYLLVVRSLLLHGFSNLRERELLSSCSVQPSLLLQCTDFHCGGFSCGAYGSRCFSGAAQGLSSCYARSLKPQAQWLWLYGLSYLPCGILPDQGFRPVSPADRWTLYQ